MKSIISLLFLLVSSCGSSDPNPAYVKMADRIMLQTARAIEKEGQLYLMGSGGAMMKEVSSLTLSFAHYGIVTEQEGRQLVMNCAEKLLRSVNTSEELRP